MSTVIGNIATLRPNSIVETQLYEVPDNTVITALLRIVNHTPGVQTYSVSLCPANWGDINSDLADFLAFEEPLLPNKHTVISIKAGAHQTVRIKEGTQGALSFHLSGIKRTS